MKKEFPKKETVYLVGTHHYCFREGEPSEIIGVKMGQPDKKAKPRLVYEVEYSDGMIDEVCVSEIGINYKILSFGDIKSGIFNNVDLGSVRFSLSESENLDFLRGFIDGYGGEEPHECFPNGFNNINEIWDKVDRLKDNLFMYATLRNY